MKNKIKNVLIFGATSSMGMELISLLKDKDLTIWAVSRKPLEIEACNLLKFNLDLSSDRQIDAFFNENKDITFDAVINFQGVAISSPVEFLEREELQKQLDVSLFSIVRILYNLKNRISKNGIIINISSMASFGIFPFLSPYSISKASSDILLNCYEMETGIKTVSVKPGVVGTKFWKFCVNENMQNFNKMTEKYKDIGSFLVDNALKNSNRGIKAADVSKLVYKILYSKNPKSSYLIGPDSYLAYIGSLFKGRFLFGLIRKILKDKVRKFKNAK